MNLLIKMKNKLKTGFYNKTSLSKIVMINFRKLLILNLFLLFCTRVTLKDFKYISRNNILKAFF